MSSASKMKAVIDRIKCIEDAISKGREYLESGDHADWRGFRPVFYGKVKGGKELPPHKDWVKNVFLPRQERWLRYLEMVREKLERSSAEKSRTGRRRSSAREIE